MNCKIFEVRDRATFMPVLAVQLDPANEAERYLLSRAGYGRMAENHRQYILLIKLEDAPYDPYNHNTRARTLPMAHHHIQENWNDLVNGQVIDVEFVKGETEQPKTSEAIAYPD